VVRFAVPPVSSSGPPLQHAFVSAVAVIPARYHSSRLPGKALADIGGRPMIEHVYRRTAAARSIASVIVATDDERIHRAVLSFGGESRLTSASHQSGSDRIAEVAGGLRCDLIVNVQGDEPLIEPAMIDEAVAPFMADPSLMMSTLRRRIEDASETQNPNVTKVVVDRDDFALYFSRAPIPFTRQGSPPAPAWRHVGLYVYRRECLLRLAALPPTAMERAEALEQLRALEYGIRIKAVETMFDSVGVDTPDDLERVRSSYAARGARFATEPASVQRA
jgi:3-deoxy-manno-octulosonate cytidylyltransferase (CMP-KDO synthetase)